jgi:S-formylglutathione hydrolase FrmB
MIVLSAGAHLSALGIASSFTLALPDSVCEASERLPYVLCLHNDTQNGERMLRSLCCDKLVDEYRYALLLPDGQNSCFMNMAYGPKWQTYLMDGLLPFAERSFPLAGKPSILGIGTGGWAAARLAKSFSSRFSAAAAVSASMELAQDYAMGRLLAKPDLEAAFGDPHKAEAFPLSIDTLLFGGEGAVLSALRRLMHTDGSAAQ